MMMIPHGRCWISATLTLVLTVLPSAQSPAPHVTSNENSFRARALMRVMPEYPATSMARGAEGVAVARVRAGIDNRIEQVDVLQSPDADTADAVRAALMRWIVPPLQPTGSTVRYAEEGKMTFYFQIRNGKGMVLNPDQMPGNEGIFTPPPTRPVAVNGAAPVVRTMGHDAVGVEEIDEDALRHLLEDESTILIDVRDRESFAASARPRAVNIPRDELLVRAGAELSRSAQIVIDCSQELLVLDSGQKLRRGDEALGEQELPEERVFLG